MKKIIIVLLIFLYPAFAAENIYRLKLISNWHKNSPSNQCKSAPNDICIKIDENITSILYQAAIDFKKNVEKSSKGKIRIQISTLYDNEKNINNINIVDLVKSGKYDIGYTSFYHYSNENAKTMFWATTPFNMTSDMQQHWYLLGNGKKLNDKLFAKHNIKVFAMGSTNMQMNGWFKKDINSLADLQGLKIQISGFNAQALTKLDIVKSTIFADELYKAFEMGTIDAFVSHNSLYDRSWEFAKTAKYYYITEQEPINDAQILINKKTYEKLPKNLQSIIEKAAKNVGENMKKKISDKNLKSLSKIKTQYPDLQIATFPAEVKTAIENALNELLDTKAQNDIIFKEVLESQRKFQKTFKEK